MSFDNNVNSALIANKQLRDAAKTPVVTEAPATPAPVADPLTKPITAPTTATPEVPVPLKAEEAVPQPAAKKPDEPAKPEKKPEASDPEKTTTEPSEEVEFKWDEGIIEPTPEAESTAQTDIKKIGSALNLEVSNEQEFVSTVTEKLTKLKELEALSLDTIPEPLKKAIEIAKQGGDWSQYAQASAVDFSSLKPEELFEQEYERVNAHRFKQADGTIDYAALDAEIDSISPGLKAMQGGAIKNALIQRQQQQQTAVLAEAAAQQDRFQKSLGEAAKEVTSLLPKEKFGIALDAKHGSYFYKGITDGSLVKKHLGNIDPSVLVKLDGKKLMKTLMIAELGEKISEFQRKQGEVIGKKALLQSTQNPVTQAASHLPRPEEPEAIAPPTSAERLAKMQTTAKPPNSL